MINTNEINQIQKNLTQTIFGNIFNETKILNDNTLLNIIDEFCKIKKPNMPNICQQFSCLKNSLKELEKAMGISINVQYINEQFWIYFINFMFDIRELEMSSIEKNCNLLKQVLRWTKLKGIKLQTNYDVYNIKPYSKQRLIIQPNELARLYYFDYTSLNKRSHHIKTLIKVKDLFILQCNLGQRYNDMQRITSHNFTLTNTFHIIQQKTNNIAILDINELAIDPNITIEILKKYNYECPYIGDISNFDRYIKEIFELVGLNDKIYCWEHLNGHNFLKEYNRAKLVTSHTGRRTFISYNMEKNKSINKIMEASGHKTIMQFFKYIQYGIYELSEY